MSVYFYPALMLAGGLGVLLRYLLGRAAINAQWTALPFGTLIANLLGCFLIGYLAASLTQKWSMSSEMQTVVLTGFLGGFTTFSAFSLEAVTMFEQDGGLPTLFYISVKVFLCILLCFAGLWLART